MAKVYNAEEVAEILGVGYRTVLRLVKEKKIKALEVGGKTRISEYQLDDYLKGGGE